MKKLPNTCKRTHLPLASLLLLISATSSHAVLPFPLSTDSSGLFTNGGWTGNGAVQPNVDPGTYTGTTISNILVQDFSSGALTVNTLGGDLFSSGRFKDPNEGVTHTITLTGGTADLRLANSNSFDAGASQWNSTGLTDFQGVTKIEFTTVFESPVAGRNTDLASITTRGLGAGLALIVAGGSQTLSSFTVGLSYDGVFSSSSANLSNPYDPSLPGYSPGVPAGAIPYQAAGFGTSVAGATTFNSTAFTALDTFLLVRGYDYDGSLNGYTAADADNVYITSMKWTITKDDNSAFSPDTLFVVSMDGQQYGTAVIPEPSSALLGMGGLLLFTLRRRRA